MRRFATLLSALVLVGGCATAAPAASSPPPVAFALRAWNSQALPPAAAFGSAGPILAIHQGVLIAQGPQDEMFPGPLLPNLQQRQISQTGIEEIVKAARAAGLLAGPTDLTGRMPLGAQTAHLLFVMDGAAREVIGDPSRQIVCVAAPCDAAPGTPEAFGQFWTKVMDLPSWLGAELGAEKPYVPERLAVLLTEPRLDATLKPSIARWPLSGEMAKFGVELPGAAGVRCGVIEGADLSAALAAFGAANELTRWTDGSAAMFGVVARPLFPDEPNPCG